MVNVEHFLCIYHGLTIYIYGYHYLCDSLSFIILLEAKQYI